MFKRLQIASVAFSAIALAALVHLPTALGTPIQWVAAVDSDWGTVGNWNFTNVPGTGDGAFFTGQTITPAVISTDVDLLGGAVDSVHVGQGTGDGAVEIVAGGNLTTSGVFSLGTDSGAVGTLTMSGGSLTAAAFTTGTDSNSSATLSGGSLTVSGALTVAAGVNAGGSSFTQGGGALSADFDADADVDADDLNHATLGWKARFGTDLGGADFLNWQRQLGMTAAGGTSVVVVDRLNIGQGAAGVYNMSSGTLTANNLIADFSAIAVGVTSQGTFNQSGGTVNHQAVHLSISKLGGSDGSAYNLSGTGILNVNNGGLLIIGNDGTGAFNQSGGTANLSNAARVGRLAVGTLDVSGGTFNAPSVLIALEDAGAAGSAVVQSGGTVNTPVIEVGGSAAGSYTLSGGLLDMQPTGSVPDPIIQVGSGAAGAGSSLIVSGGTLNTTSINPGAFAQATMAVSGTADVNVSGNMQISAAPGSGGSSLSVAGGTLDANSIFVGVGGGIGSANLTGGTVTTAGAMRVAEAAAAGGSFVTQSNGTLDGGGLVVGFRASATYTMTGGSILSDRIDLGGDIGAPGDFGTGVLNMSAGTVNTIGGTLVDHIAPEPGGVGTMNLSGTASYTSEAISVGDNLIPFDGTLAGKTAGGTGLLSINGSNVNLSLGGIWIGATGTLEMVADASGVSTIVTTGGVHALGGGTFLLGALDIDLSAIASNADITLIDNTDASAGVLGTFTGLSEGTTFVDSSGTKNATITYVGGVGSNDVLLTNITDIPALAAATIPEPASALMLLIGLASLASARRSHRRFA